MAKRRRRAASIERVEIEERDQVEHRDALIRVPIAEPPEAAYQSDHVEVGALSVQQRRNLKRLFWGLTTRHCQLANGRHVDSNADVIRFVLEAVPE